MFVCTRCGLCCKNIDSITELAEFDRGDGVCIHLTDENLCDIYSARPDICNVDKMYALHYKKLISRMDYEEKNLEGCKILRRKNHEV